MPPRPASWCSTTLRESDRLEALAREYARLERAEKAHAVDRLTRYGLHASERHTRGKLTRDADLTRDASQAPGGVSGRAGREANGTREWRSGARDSSRPGRKKNAEQTEHARGDQKVARESGHGRQHEDPGDSERNVGVCPVADLHRSASWVKLPRGWIWKGPMVHLAPRSGPARHCLPRVRSRPPGWFDPIEVWKKFSLDTLGAYEAYPGPEPPQGFTPYVMQRWREAPRTAWPPLPGRPVRGWRAWWCAGVIIGWRHRDPMHRYFRKWTWLELHRVMQGQQPFSIRLWRRVLEQIEYKEQHERAYQAQRRAARGKRVWSIAIDPSSGAAALQPVPLGKDSSSRPTAPIMIPPSAWDQRTTS